MRTQLGGEFGRLWSAYAVSTYGTWTAFGAFPLLAVRVLHSSPVAVSLLEAAGLAVAAVAAFPLGPWADRRPPRPVLVTMDLVRFAALAGVPLAYWCGRLSYGLLLAVSVLCGTAGIAFTAASSAYLKRLVRPGRLLVATGRFEATSWSATAVGPPLGGALIGLLGPVVTVLADAVSYLVSALILGRAGGAAAEAPGPRAAADLRAGRRLIRRDPVLWRLFVNSVLVNGLIMATAPVLAVLLLGRYHVPAWQYGLAFGVPALGGLAGARLSARLAARHGRHRVLIVSGWLRSLIPLGLALVRPGLPGVLTVIVVEALLITCMGVYTPIQAAERLRRAPAGHAAQVVTTWTAGSRLVQAALILGAGALATRIGPPAALTVAGLLLLPTPLLLPRSPAGDSAVPGPGPTTRVVSASKYMRDVGSPGE